MKKTMILLIIAASFYVYAAPMLTSIGTAGKNLEKYGLIVKSFEFRNALSRDEALQLCEAIDNSNLLLIYTGTESINLAFADKSVQLSVTKLFQRKGAVCLVIPSWSWMKNRPLNMYNYFKTAGIELPTTFYGHKKGGICKIAENFTESWLTTPNKGYEIHSRGHMGNKLDSKWKSLILSAENFPVMAMREDVYDKGMLVVSFSPMLHYNIVSPFGENLITKMYGNRKAGFGRRLKSKNTKTALTSTIKYMNLSKNNEIKLVNAFSGKIPECSTTVKTAVKENILNVNFICDTPAPDKLKRKITARDGAVWTDDCIEFFITNGIKNSAIVYQFIVNANGALYDSKGGAAQWNCQDIKISAKVTASGYEIVVNIPLSALGLNDKSLFRLNFCRNAKAGVTKGKYELQSYNPTNSFAAVSTMAYAGFADKLKLPTLGSVNNATDIEIYRVPQFTRIFSDYEPPAGTPQTKIITMTTARNDREGTPIVVVNNSNMNIRYRLEPDFYLKGTDIPYRKLINIRELLPYRAISHQVFYEIISNLNEAGVISVPCNDLSALYLEVYTMLEAGKYQWGFTLIPVNADMPQRRVEVEVEVVKFTMPEKLGLDFYLFGPYVAEQRYHVGSPFFTKGQFNRYIEFFKSYHVSCIHVHDPLNKAVKISDGKILLSDKKEDYIFNEKLWQNAGLEWSYHYGVWAVLCSRLKAAKLPATLKDPKIKALFEEAIKRWSKFMKADGIDMNRCYAPVWDEPRSADIEETRIAAEIVRKYGFRVNQTMANWSVLDDFKKLKKSVDYWIPIEYLLTNSSTAPSILEVIRSSGIKLAPYMCSVGGNVEHYHNYYRFRGIREYMLNANGIFFWAANSYRGNDYDSREDKKMRGVFLVHHSETGPVSTIRFEALREAIEDLYYLKQAAKSANPELRRLVSFEVLNTLLKNNDPLEMANWHDNLLRKLSK